MKYILLVLLFYNSFISCVPNNNQHNKSIDEIKITDSNLIYDFFENDLNRNYLVIGSPLYDSILSFYKPIVMSIEFNKITSDHRDTIILKNFKSDLKLIHRLYISGSELKFHPYLVKSEDTLTIYNPELVKGDCSIMGNDTLIGMVSSAGIFDLIFKIPKDSLVGTK
ncbi:MAG: hypothetical protein ACOVO9_00025, partial [Bacteroidia bacterium]